jgi:predicted AAA+ superfamily ATPase
MTARRRPSTRTRRLFFQRTFITEGMRLLLDSVVKRLSGKGGDPVIQLQTAFGGGKTHTMLAVYHLAKGDAPGQRFARRARHS